MSFFSFNPEFNRMSGQNVQDAFSYPQVEAEGYDYTNQDAAKQEWLARRSMDMLSRIPEQREFRGKDAQFLADTAAPGGVYGGYTNSDAATLESARRGIIGSILGAYPGKGRQAMQAWGLAPNPLLSAIHNGGDYY